MEMAGAWRSLLLLGAVAATVFAVPVIVSSSSSSIGANNPYSPTTTVATTTTQAPKALAMTCPSDMVVATARGLTRASAKFGAPFVADIPASYTSISCSHKSGAFFQLGSTRVTYFVTDLLTGITSECNFMVTVVGMLFACFLNPFLPIIL